MKQNITLSLDSVLLRQARVYAAQRGKSISALLSDELRTWVENQARYEQAKQEALSLLDKKFDLSRPDGGHGIISREDLHERQNLR